MQTWTQSGFTCCTTSHHREAAVGQGSRAAKTHLKSGQMLLTAQRRKLGISESSTGVWRKDSWIHTHTNYTLAPSKYRFVFRAVSEKLFQHCNIIVLVKTAHYFLRPSKQKHKKAEFVRWQKNEAEWTRGTKCNETDYIDCVINLVCVFVHTHTSLPSPLFPILCWTILCHVKAALWIGHVLFYPFGG